ncbi:cytochrome P450 monooxygenase [Microthyrium microscopicum]|uniref:Cytochrome P450 monooxygenase n=1 Tax=Microthyrium microscopicum TaxID=703497 RepID=A0A6A6UBZ4_9PEZI|nr:cytochrome P450 monooxygenase [Microthyrium microscopicum]
MARLKTSQLAPAALTVTITLIVLKLTGSPLLATYSVWRVTSLAIIIPFGLIFTWILWIYPVFLDPLRKIPGVKGGKPLIGYLLEQRRRPVSNLLKDWMLQGEHQGLFRVPHVLGSNVILTCNTEVLSEIFVTKAYDFEKTKAGVQILRVVLGDGLVTTEGDIHKFQRKKVNPMFSARRIKNMHHLLWSKASSLADCVKDELHSKASTNERDVIEVGHWASRTTLDIIGTAAFGYDLDTLRHPDNELAEMYAWLFEPTRRMTIWFGLNLLGFPRSLMKLIPWDMEQQVYEKSQGLRRICQGFIDNKRKVIEKQEIPSVDILSHLIESNCFSDKELVDQLLTFLAAGHETTSSAFSWTLYTLATHPTYQSRLRHELATTLPEDPSATDPLTLASTLESLPLLNGICSEVQRLWPSVPQTVRVTNRDTSLGNYFIPKDTVVATSIWFFNRLPSLWGPRAEEFLPERWIDEASGKPNNHGGAKNNYASMTFLHGPRNCIGQGLSKAELRVLVAVWVRNFEFEMARPEEEVVPVGNVTIKPKGGLDLRMKIVGA